MTVRAGARRRHRARWPAPRSRVARARRRRGRAGPRCRGRRGTGRGSCWRRRRAPRRAAKRDRRSRTAHRRSGHRSRRAGAGRTPACRGRAARPCPGWCRAIARANSTRSSSAAVPSRSRSAHAWSRPIVAPRPSDGFVHAHASPSATTPGGDGLAVDHERAVTVFDLGHDVDGVGEWLAVHPVRDERVAARRTRSHDVDMAGCSHRLVVRARNEPDAPRAVVGGQREDRDRLVRLQQAAECRRHRAVVGAEVAAVVDEATVLELFDRCGARRCRRASGGARSAGRPRRPRGRRAARRRPR